ncbi:MAG TPA: CoA pyrophosphatase [Candidatus Binatia bacterium]|nr:CoA pyrophosphatase [Candidatus Binatia bacterium]
MSIAPLLQFSTPLRQEIGARLASFERETCPLEHRVAAAVAVVIVRDEAGNACFVLTRRAARLANHGGQWALPGGRMDDGETAAAAALRELHEEVGLETTPEAVLGLLDDYPTRSGFVITPVVVWAGEDAQLVPDPREVAAAYRIPLAELDRPGVPRLRRIPESDRPVISIPLVGTHVHAPTAAVIFQFREVGLHGRATRVAHFEQPVFAWR